MISEYLPVEAECTQRSLPSTRSPVSSKCATSDPAILSRTSSVNPSSPPGGARAHRRNGARRDGGAEQLGQRGRGAGLGQELPDVEVDHDRADPRPVLDRRADALGCLAGGDRAATASALDELLLDDAHRDWRDVEHLPTPHPDQHGTLEARPASPARPRLVARSR